MTFINNSNDDDVYHVVHFIAECIETVLKFTLFIKSHRHKFCRKFKGIKN